MNSPFSWTAPWRQAQRSRQANARFYRTWDLAGALFLAWVPATGQSLVIENYTFADVHLAPPDGSPVGATDVRTIHSAITQITDVNVRLTLASAGPGQAYNGDYYAYLQHGDGFAVLLNRVGRRVDAGDPAASFGYGDNGMHITLDDQASNGDIHSYRLELSVPPSHVTPIDPGYALSLTGAWQPDGRNVNPAAVADTDPRSALLGDFIGMSAEGPWRLFVADLNSSGSVLVTDWGVDLQGIAVVPETPVWGVAGAAALLGFTALRVLRARRLL